MQHSFFFSFFFRERDRKREIEDEETERRLGEGHRWERQKESERIKLPTESGPPRRAPSHDPEIIT